MVVHDDQLWFYINELTWFSMVMVLIKGTMGMLISASNLSTNFLYPLVDYWCTVPALGNLSQDEQRYLVSPDGDGCSTYDVPWQNYTKDDIGSWDWTYIKRSEYNKVDCEYGWTYDYSIFYAPTAVTEWDLVCDDGLLMGLISPVYMTGLFVGSIILGPFSDRYGRLKGVMVFLMLYIVSGLVCVFAPNVWVYMFARSLLGLSVRVFNVCAVVLVLELNIPRYRAALIVADRVIYCIGIILVSCLAYFIRHFRLLQLILIIPAIPLLSIYWIFPESPRWLLSKGRPDETCKAVKKLASRYGCSIPETVMKDYAYQKFEKVERKYSEEQLKTKSRDMISHPIIRRYLLIMSYLMTAALFIYFGVSMNMGELVGDIYLNTVLAGATEIPSLLLVLWSMPRLGRKLTLLLCFLVAFLTGAFSIISLLIPGMELGSMISLIICRGAAGCSICAMTTFNGELFPTPYRQTAGGITIAISSLVTIFAPYIGGPLTAVWQPLPNVIFTVLVLIAVIMVSFLPETLYQRLPETTADSANFMKHKVVRRGLFIVPSGGEREPLLAEDSKKSASS